MGLQSVLFTLVGIVIGAILGFYFTKKRFEKELKENCDFIIVCYHGGFEKSLDENMTPTEALTKENQGSELLENFDSINMILSGHQHRSFITKIKDVICSQPMHNGQSFTKVVIDTESNDISYELVKK